MADLALKAAVAGVVARAVSAIELLEVYNSLTLGASVDITAGQAIRIGAQGTWVLAQADAAGHAVGVYIASKTVKAGMSLTGIRKGVIDGIDISGLAYGASVYLSNTAGALADAAGTVSLVLARVVALTGNVIGDSPNKVLEVDCPL